MVKDLIFISNARHINKTIHTILDVGDMHELYSMLIENHYLFIYSTVEQYINRSSHYALLQCMNTAMEPEKHYRLQ